MSKPDAFTLRLGYRPRKFKPSVKYMRLLKRNLKIARKTVARIQQQEAMENLEP